MGYLGIKEDPPFWKMKMRNEKMGVKKRSIEEYTTPSSQLSRVGMQSAGGPGQLAPQKRLLTDQRTSRTNN